MRPAPGEVLHFSEDPNITGFSPHVAATAQQPEAYVWAVDAARSPDYWFPRQCPRAMAWVTDRTTLEDRVRVFGAGAGPRVHAIEYAWLDAMRTTTVYAYRFDAADFAPFPDEDGKPDHAHVATRPVRPLGPPEPIGDLLVLHADAGIELRVLPNLWPWWDAVRGASLAYSGIRLRNALPRPA